MNLKNKKIAVVGAGMEGVSSVKFLSGKASAVYLLDKKNESDLEPEFLGEISKLGAKTVLGRNYLDNLKEFDIVFRSPGVRPDLPQLKEAGKRGVEITSQTMLFFDLCPSPIVGVTGTKGKGTTSTLVYKVLKAAGREAFIGGNIGSPPLDFVDQVSKDSVVILELSSFQLIDLKKSPHIAVVLMITNEHLDWHESREEYVESKKTIVNYQNTHDQVVANADDILSRQIGETSKAKKYYFSTKKQVKLGAYVDRDFIVSVTNGWTTTVKIADIKLPGEHNLQNAAAAVVVAGVLEISPKIISSAVSSFKGLPHRLEFVGEIGKVKYYNDSASTIPETTIAAIKSFSNPKVLILGGSSKKSDFSLVAQEIVKNNVKAVILIGDEARTLKENINTVGNFSGEIIEGLDTMREIVGRVEKIASAGDVVVLSPACASFGMFRNYVDRGEQFKKAVRFLG
jgi:UDP-N-acetylmuramoylalanine--D-glutamate ligase